jgi:hypothetical protein
MPRSISSWRYTRSFGSLPTTAEASAPTGNMYVWDYKGISVTYILLDPQREVAVLRVDRFPA